MTAELGLQPLLTLFIFPRLLIHCRQLIASGIPRPTSMIMSVSTIVELAMGF